MKRILLGVWGAAILGLSAISTSTTAMPLANAGLTAPVDGSSAAAPVETVGWRTVCRTVPRWRYGQQYMVERCRNVWVDRGWGRGPGYGGPGPYGGAGFYGAPPPPPPSYGWGYRGGPGYY